MNKYNFEVSFFSELYNIKTVLMDILRFLKNKIPMITQDELNEIKLIFSELLCNAVIHGNKEDLSKKVNVSIELADDIVNAVITDEGTGFDYMALLHKAVSNEALTHEHGRGIYLVYSLTDSMVFNIKGNQIQFYRRVNVDGENSCSRQ